MSPLSADRRRDLLDEYHALEGTQTAEAARTRSALRREYEESLPVVALSRCPFTKQVVRHSLDVDGFDGLWWRYAMPVRAVIEDLPPTFFALTGAVRLSGPVEQQPPFLARLGPEVPFVVPRMLLHDDVKAVVSHVRVAGHDAYPIVYFAQPTPFLLERFNTWGADHYTFEGAGLADGWHSIEEDRDPLDTDLARWIESGDLLWIAPDDKSMTLKTTTSGCPYLGLPGSTDFTDLDGSDLPKPVKRSRR